MTNCKTMRETETLFYEYPYRDGLVTLAPCCGYAPSECLCEYIDAKYTDTTELVHSDSWYNLRSGTLSRFSIDVSRSADVVLPCCGTSRKVKNLEASRNSWRAVAIFASVVCYVILAVFAYATLIGA